LNQIDATIGELEAADRISAELRSALVCLAGELERHRSRVLALVDRQSKADPDP